MSGYKADLIVTLFDSSVRRAFVGIRCHDAKETMFRIAS